MEAGRKPASNCQFSLKALTIIHHMTGQRVVIIEQCQRTCRYKDFVLECFSWWTISISNLLKKKKRPSPPPVYPQKGGRGGGGSFSRSLWQQKLYSLPTSVANLLLSNHLINTCSLQEKALSWNIKQNAKRREEKHCIWWKSLFLCKMEAYAFLHSLKFILPFYH